jgi:hypothetical protein
MFRPNVNDVVGEEIQLDEVELHNFSFPQSIVRIWKANIGRRLYSSEVRNYLQAWMRNLMDGEF